MDTPVDRALLATAAHDYSGGETRALLRLALDADHDGENCVTSLARVHQFAGYAPDPSFSSARRALKRFLADGALRVDYELPGIGRLFTVCPAGPWSGRVRTDTMIGRKVAARLERERYRKAVEAALMNVAHQPAVRPPGALLTVPQLAERLQVSPSTVYDNAGRWGGLKVGGAWRFEWKTVRAALRPVRSEPQQASPTRAGRPHRRPAAKVDLLPIKGEPRPE